MGSGGTQWRKAFSKSQGGKGQVYGLGSKVWAPVSPFTKCSKQLLQRNVGSSCEPTSGGFGTVSGRSEVIRQAWSYSLETRHCVVWT